MVQVPGTVELGAVGMVPPERVISVVVGTAVNVPPQVVVAAGVLAIEMPVPIVDRLSVKPTLVALVDVLRLLSVIVSVETPVCGMLVGLKALLPVMAETCSVAVAEL